MLTVTFVGLDRIHRCRLSLRLLRASANRVHELDYALPCESDVCRGRAVVGRAMPSPYHGTLACPKPGTQAIIRLHVTNPLSAEF